MPERFIIFARDKVGNGDLDEIARTHADEDSEVVKHESGDDVFYIVTASPKTTKAAMEAAVAVPEPEPAPEPEPEVQPEPEPKAEPKKAEPKKAEPEQKAKPKAKAKA